MKKTHKRRREEIIMGFGSKIRAMRELRGWNQGELADRSGVRQTHLSQIERENIEAPHMKTMRKLLDALGVDPDRLFKHLLVQANDEIVLDRYKKEVQGLAGAPSGNSEET